ncbi:MAG TPA: hypothetical protein VGD81_15105 [Opitutaceae bacterium]
MILTAVRANVAVLQQGIDLLATLGADRYTRRVPVCFDAAPGGHIRHIIDHYLGLLDGLGRGEVDYEHRARDPLVERDVDYARGVMESIVARLEELARADGDCALQVHAETADPAGGRSATGSSSLLRELEFLLSHTVHHYALVAMMCRILGHEPPRDFGVAPSTMKYRREQALKGGAVLQPAPGGATSAG